MSAIKALSFRQPWAELILQGRKTMDLRTYNTHHRGRILIHAAQTVESDACRLHGIDPSTVATGAFVGSVTIVDVVPLTEEHYAATRDQHLAGRHFQPGMYGWILAGPVRLPQPIPAPGRTNMFTVNMEIGDWRGAMRRLPCRARRGMVRRSPRAAAIAPCWRGRRPNAPLRWRCSP